MFDDLFRMVSTAAQVLAGEKTPDELLTVVSDVRETHAANEARAALPANLTRCACDCYFVPVPEDATKCASCLKLGAADTTPAPAPEVIDTHA